MDPMDPPPLDLPVYNVHVVRGGCHEACLEDERKLDFVRSCLRLLMEMMWTGLPVPSPEHDISVLVHYGQNLVFCTTIISVSMVFSTFL